jgi:hypothetical protein
MTKKFLFGAAVVLAIAGLATSNVSALCNPPKFTATFNSLSGAYTYFNTTVPNATLVGRLWSPLGDHTGTCNTDHPFLYFGADTSLIGMSLALGEGCVVGCPAGSLSLQVTASNGSASETVITTAPETPTGGLNFDFSTRGHAMGNSKPKVTTSSRAGNTVSLTVNIDPVGAFDGAAADISGINILSAPGLTDPGRNAAAYAPKAVAPVGGGAVPLTFDCSLTPALQDVWIVTQVATLSGGANPTVSGATRVKCNSALATPKYTVVPKKSMGTSTQH